MPGVADLIVVDAPAAGHAVGFLRSPVGVRDAARTGTLHRQAVEVLELIGDPERCRVMLVTIPEETPVNEVVETSFAIEDEAGVKLGPVIVNGVLPTLTGLDADLTPLGRTDAEQAALATAATFRRRRTALQDAQFARLDDRLPLEQLRLPQLFGTVMGPSEIDELATRLLAEIRDLPELP